MLMSGSTSSSSLFLQVCSSLPHPTHNLRSQSSETTEATRANSAGQVEYIQRAEHVTPRA